MNVIRGLLWLVLALLFNTAGAQEFVPVPKLTAHVMDQAGMLNSEQRNALDNVLRDYEARTGNQIAILLTNSTEPEAIEQYSIRVADEWQLGRKGVDDGVLLVVAKNNPKSLRRLRIEAGRGVQGVLSDAQSKRILQDVIAPHFRQNDFYGGLAAGVSAITSLLDREQFPAPNRQSASQADEEQAGDSLFPFLVFGVFLIFLIASRMRTPRNRFGQDRWGRSLPGVILGGGLGGLGGYGSSGSGWGGGSGFSGGGGGFSGGGGGFDGGGASGDW